MAIGANCCSPNYIEGLLETAKQKTAKPMIVYPNSGEGWDASTQLWITQDEGSNYLFWPFIYVSQNDDRFPTIREGLDGERREGYRWMLSHFPSHN